MKNEIMSNENTNLITTLVENGFYSSFNANDEKEKELLFNALANPDTELAKMINKKIDIINVVAEQIEVTNEETGEVSIAPRIIIIDKDYNSYSCVSVGIRNSLSRLFSIFGPPCVWDSPFTMLVGQKKIKGNKNVLTLTIPSDKS